jgi:hypothetical protein
MPPRPIPLPLAALAAALLLAGPAAAQVAAFEPESYGSAQLVVRQNVGDAARFIAASEGGAFEPIAELTPSDRLAALARPVGRIDVLLRDPQTGEEGASACTGALLGDGLVLTNHHCLPQDGSLEVLAASILMDYLRLNGEGSQRFDLDPAAVDWSPDLDFAVARVEGAPEAIFGTVALGALPEQAGAARTVIHHPLGNPKVMSRFRCFVFADGRLGPPGVPHRCDTLPGSSGSLLLDDRGVAVALHFAGGLDPVDATSFNMAVDIGAILQASEVVRASPAAQAAADPGTGPAPTSAAGAGPDPARDAADEGPLDAGEMTDILRGN